MIDVESRRLLFYLRLSSRRHRPSAPAVALICCSAVAVRLGIALAQINDIWHNYSLNNEHSDGNGRTVGP